jgi:hypothetical protein
MDEIEAQVIAPQQKKPGFWKREFGPEVTEAQQTFDVLVGIIAPILALIFDPVVFRGGPCGSNSLTAQYSLFAYCAIGLGILALVTWLGAGGSLGLFTGVLAGVLVTGSIFATAVGVIMLPISLIGLIVCIGVLGLLPFLTAVVYLRNGIRALWAGYQQTQFKLVFSALVISGIVMVLGLPALIQWPFPDTVLMPAECSSVQ